MGERRSPVEQLLDVAVYAPIGLLANLEELLPQLVERGQQQVAMARTFGRFAVQAGTDEARRRLDRVGGPSPAPAAPPAPAAGPAAAASSQNEPAPAAAGVDVDAASAGGPEAVDADSLGIPDYDSLAASQVLPRLAGLTADELDAVRRYESAGRGRRTVLSKIAQLQA